ncbi:hypothetical protein HME9302_01923 [Alteripontixanthobacter maritimus]|uniref:Structural protein MipA n=1 Tax=Alteripontixanthobacter maritimus TaxID=2161824 RepID=A0A369QEJ0_9SPHN|nr:MipA/OmpV family protein [Alteripontixanthobacter maritimus]RDC60708.1 hypothetical protein HME9302_01923 [Alteripontixanthobacter maritimus]
MTKTFIAARLTGTAIATSFAIAAPLAAQTQGEPGLDGAAIDNEAIEEEGVPGDPFADSVFAGDFLTIGAGAAFGPSYSGSDDYVVFPLPLVQGSYKGVDFNPRPGGLAFDFMPDFENGPNISLGVAGRINGDRANNIEDPVVEALGELDTAIEVGPTAGIGFSGVLNPFDSMTFTVDALFDVAGAHNGARISPSLTYFTPLSRGIATSLSLSTSYVSDDFADYYYTVTPRQTLLPEVGLPAYQADGGFNSAGVNALVVFDLGGDLTDGGLSIATIAGYSRLLGDAKRTPLTSIRGSADQFLLGAGLGYTF